eukprot:TRINITY_DN6744_c0_g1_i2.p1 TRINITY_DN6744_c0_g1~~TRINITY_DN6744_c0_g1_i2.p1  ORF type:complete len:580 (-),score=146.87 TRINITY_DN6744_c0_g1_i2:150-1889(-)
MKVIAQMRRGYLVRTPRRAFTVYTNQRVLVDEEIGTKHYYYDTNIWQYMPPIRALLQRRWTRKEEVPPKIAILEELPELRPQLEQQRLITFTKLFDIPRLARMHEVGEIDTAYLISILCEDHFKPLIDALLSKVLVSGAMPPLERRSEHEALRQEVIRLYRVFFFGDEVTELERDLEYKYLYSKQEKYFQFLLKAKPTYQCIWTVTNQRRLEFMVNAQARDLNWYSDYKPIFEPANLAQRYQLSLIEQELSKEPWYRRFFSTFMFKRFYLPSKTRAENITQILLNRILTYTSSLEFTRVMNIPPDFHIELAVLNTHVWLLYNRLRAFEDHIEVKVIRKHLLTMFGRISVERGTRIHLRKKDDFIKDVNHYMLTIRNSYDRHFVKNPVTAATPLYKLDALIWSTVFFEKVTRYAPEVYLMAQYIYQQMRYLDSLPLEAFLDADIDWDVFRIPIDYKSAIAKLNPPLSPEEYEKEVASDKKFKRHYYSFDEPNVQLPMDAELSNVIDRRYAVLGTKVKDVLLKYRSLETYDFYSERDEKSKQSAEKAKKYTWKGRGRELLLDAENLRKARASKRDGEPINK